MKIFRALFTCSSLFLCQHSFAASPGVSLCELQVALAEAGVEAAWLPYALEVKTRPLVEQPVIKTRDLEVGQVVDVFVGQALPHRSVVVAIDETRVSFRSLQLQTKNQILGGIEFDSKGFPNTLGVDIEIPGFVVGHITVPALQVGEAARGPAVRDGYLISDLQGAHTNYLRVGLRMGDIISSRSFAFAVKKHNRDYSGSVPHHLITDSNLFGEGSVDSQYRRVIRRATLGLGGDKGCLDLTAFDASRGSAPFMVISEAYQRGEPGTTLYTAVRLQDGQVRVPIEFVSFSQQSSFTHTIQGIVSWGSGFPQVTAK